MECVWCGDGDAVSGGAPRDTRAGTGVLAIVSRGCSHRRPPDPGRAVLISPAPNPRTALLDTPLSPQRPAFGCCSAPSYSFLTRLSAPFSSLPSTTAIALPLA